MCLMEDNAEIRAAVLKSVDGLSDQQLNQKSGENWSIAQVLIHLFLLEKGVAKSIVDTLKNGEEQQVDMKPIHLVPDRSKKIKAPPFLEPRDEFTSMEAIRTKLEESRKALQAAISGVSHEQLEKKVMPHPAFGPMNLKQWVELIGLHEKRHLAQIEEIKRDLLGL